MRFSIAIAALMLCLTSTSVLARVACRLHEHNNFKGEFVLLQKNEQFFATEPPPDSAKKLHSPFTNTIYRPSMYKKISSVSIKYKGCFVEMLTNPKRGHDPNSRRFGRVDKDTPKLDSNYRDDVYRASCICPDR